MSERNKKLTNKQRVFIDEYLIDFNATQAAIRAGYSAKTAGSIGAENLTKPEIKEEIEARLAEVHMSADEALKRISEIARGDIAQIMDISGVGFSLNMAMAKELGLTKLIKKVKQKTVTHIAKSESDEDREVVELEVELYDSQAALRDILKLHGKFTDRVDVTSGGEKITEIGVKLIDYRTGITPSETGSSGDSSTSSQDKDTGNGSQVG